MLNSKLMASGLRSNATTFSLLGAVAIVAGSLSACAVSDPVNNPMSGAGGSGTTSVGGTSPVGAGGSAGSGVGGVGIGGTAGAAGGPPADCNSPHPGAAPLRRLSRFEYNNTLADEGFLGDPTNPANFLPAEIAAEGAHGADFGNDVGSQSTNAALVEGYSQVAENVTSRITTDAAALGALAPCYATVTAETEEACARSFIESFGAKAFRRPLETTEVDELLALEREIRLAFPFEDSLGAAMEALLQSPEFLYRPEFGVPDAATGLLRPSGYEMATRLSYLLWGTLPDETLMTAAASGELLTDAGVEQHAQRMIADRTRVRPVLQQFFDRYLPLQVLTDLSRDEAQYPTFSPAIGALMRQETQTFMEHIVYDGPGTWPEALKANYTFANPELANYYGLPAPATDTWEQVALDPAQQRMGVLTQGGVMAGTTVSNVTNPVRRGAFLLTHIMCEELEPPPPNIADIIMPPEVDSAPTGRERYSMHSEQLACAGCHAQMDPPGFALENFDAVGQWRDTENGVTIDASGELDLVPAPFSGPRELLTMVADSPATQACFAENWMHFGYGRSIEAADACSMMKVEDAFTASGYNIQQLLVSLTQSDAFLYLAPEQP